MEQYAEVVLDLAGNAVPGASVQVLVGSVNGSLATIYDAGGTPQQNPIPTGQRGEFAFQAANGKYVLRVLINGTPYATVGPLTFYDPNDDTGRVTADSVNTAVANAVPGAVAATLGGSDGASKVSTTAGGTGAVVRSVQNRLRDTVSIRDFGAIGDGIANDTAALQAAYTACALAGKVPRITAGVYKVTSTIDAKGLPLYGEDRMLSKVVAAQPDNTPTFANVGQVVRDFCIEGTGPAKKPDGIKIGGYKRYITGMFFHQLGAAICPSDIIVTTVVSANEFLACESAINDKLLDGTNAHTTLYFTDNNVLYCSKAFDMRTEAAGFMVQGNVFEDLFVIYEGNGKQLFGSLFAANWVEQMSRSVTLLSNVFSGSTNQYLMNQLRPGGFAVNDAFKWSAGQYNVGGDASGGGGGVSSDTTGVRISDFLGNGVQVWPQGIRPSARTAGFANAADIRIETQAAGVNVASRGGDIVVAPGVGTYGQRGGALRPDVETSTDLGAQDKRWGKTWLTYLKASGGGAYVAPGAAFHEISNNQPNGITLATYSTDTNVNTVVHQVEFVGPGTGSLFLGKNNDAITFRVAGNGNVTNTNNSYGAISDLKLKENIKDTTPKLADLMKVRIVNFNLKDRPQEKQIGVIAQELEEVFPGMVEDVPDFEMVSREREVPAVVDEVGVEIEPARVEEYREPVWRGTYTKQVKYSVFVPILVKAVQEIYAAQSETKT